MTRLYFKKLLSVVVGFVLWAVIYFIGFNLLLTVSNIFENQILYYFIVYGIPLIIILAIVFNRRAGNVDLKRSYKNAFDNSKPSLKEEIMYILKSSDFQAEILAFASFFIPFDIIVGFGAEIPWWASIITAIVVLGALVAICGVFDFILWTIVHINWRKKI